MRDARTGHDGVLSDSTLPAVHHAGIQHKVQRSRLLLTLLLGEAGDHAHQRLVAPTIHVQPAAGHSRRGALTSRDGRAGSCNNLARSSQSSAAFRHSSGSRVQSCSEAGQVAYRLRSSSRAAFLPSTTLSDVYPRGRNCTQGRAQCGDPCCRSALHLQSRFRAGRPPKSSRATRASRSHAPCLSLGPRCQCRCRCAPPSACRCWEQ